MPTATKPDLIVNCHVGQAITATLTIADRTGAAADPAAITAKLTDPTGTTTSPTVTDETGTGIYSVTVTPTSPGRWWLWVRATSPNVATSIALDVPDPGVPAPY